MAASVRSVYRSEVDREVFWWVCDECDCRSVNEWRTPRGAAGEAVRHNTAVHGGRMA